MARTIVAGNWKMHHGPEAARGFVESFLPHGARDGVEVILFPPTVSLQAAREARPRNARMDFGVQNVHWEAEGAFTGEISVAMAREAGAVYALVGHSERRQLFHETDAMVARKVRAALAGELRPVACVGETLEERDEGRLEEILRRQGEAIVSALERPEDAKSLVMAYEPVWAIGTGRTATPADAAQAHELLRGILATRLADAAAQVPILYGGSVKPKNAGELMAQADVDGVLVGGASLDPESFRSIARAA